mmetsp:Transcript_13801/g.23760  ORF Transcript_13801/g.23760 Transcript_13801/m.23760 type:complete len:222 (+) Transcript_13801:261-926(+)
MTYMVTPRLHKSTALVNSRFGSSTNSTAKGAVKPPRISVMAVTPALVPAPSSLKSFTKGISKISVPLMEAMAQPSPTLNCAACPPGSMPFTMAPFPSGRWVTMPKPGEASCGGLKVKGPCFFMEAPLGAIINLALTSSGAMISVVPTQLRAMVPDRLLATPKSISFTGVVGVICCPQTKTFSAFRSRCTTSLSWMNFSPAAVCLVTLFTTSSGRLFCPSLM